MKTKKKGGQNKKKQSLVNTHTTNKPSTETQQIKQHRNQKENIRAKTNNKKW